MTKEENMEVDELSRELELDSLRYPRTLDLEGDGE